MAGTAGLDAAPQLCSRCTLVTFAAAQDPLDLAPPPESESQPQQPVFVATQMAREDVYAPLDRAVAYLVREQHPDGAWGQRSPSVLEVGFDAEAYPSWQMGASALACMALSAVSETPVRRRALERGVRWLVTEPVPARPSDWDQDHVWAALYGFVACVELQGDARFQNAAWGPLLRERTIEFLEILERYQAVSGGWAYYDDPPFLKRPTWATSFCTALILPPLLRARELGFDVDSKLLERGRRYIELCALPGGAYSYDLTPVPRLSGVEHINRIEGSLGRTQVCNWALQRAGKKSITPDVLREGLEAFFRYHAFLDHVRTRPIPHEGFHANAGYFYFFAHYYAALAIEALPPDEREGMHARLRPHVVKTLWKSGGTNDFISSDSYVTSSTAFAVLSLAAGLSGSDPIPAQADQRTDDSR